MREYEAMLMLPADADESTVGTVVDRITRAVSEHGGSVGAIDRWGRRRLAYEIAHQHEGYYLVVRFTADPAAQVELERALNLADEVVRFKVLLLPETKKVSKKVPETAPEKVQEDAPETAPETENAKEASPAPA